MAKKKRESLIERIGDTFTDMAEATSVVATGSTIEMLELAAEEKIKSSRRKMKVVGKKKAAAKNATKLVKKKRTSKRAKKRL